MRVLFLVSIILFSGCLFHDEPFNPGANQTVQGLKPIYNEIDESVVYSTDPQNIEQLENLVLYNQYILVVELFQGIHVIDNADPENPVSVAFWNIPGAKNFSITNNTLFLPIGPNLYAIDITDIHNIFLISITEDAFESFLGELAPEGYLGSFECVDSKKGTVIGWQEALITDPKCWR